MVAYIIKVILCSGILYLYYVLFLRNRKFHSYNRFYLLFAVVASFIIPFVQVKMPVQVFEQAPAMLNLLYAEQSLKEVVVQSSRLIVSWKLFLFVAAAVISGVLLFLVVKRVAGIFRLKKQYMAQQADDITIITTNLPEAPFSFFRNLFWREDISLEEEAGRQIMRHEMAHIRQRHSWDRVFLQTVKAVCWFNPVFYLIEKEITLIHEYIADEQAIASKDGRAFAAMLLRSQLSSFSYSPGQAIFYSSIQKRFTMLTDNKKTNFSYTRRLMAWPVVAGLAVLFACQTAEKDEDKTVKTSDAANVVKEKAAHDEVAATPDKESVYPGNWELFLQKNLNSNVPVEKNAVPGQYRVTVAFNVDAEGNVTDVKALNDPGYGTAAEALRVITASGRWVPAQKNGRNVASQKKQSIVFVVSE